MTASHSWLPIDLREIEDNPAPELAISGLLYSSGLHVLYGEPETSKSWLAVIFCLEQLRNESHVCYLDFEMAAPTMHERLVDLGATDDDLARFLYFNPSESILNKQVQADVHKLLEDKKPTLVVVDALAGMIALHGLDGNDTSDIEQMYQTILSPFRAMASVLALDHVAKDRETRGRWPIGSQRKLGGADVALLMETVGEFSRGGKGLFRLRVQKDRFGGLPRPYAAELELESDPETETVTYRIKHSQTREGGRSQRPTDCMDKVLELLSETPEPVTRSFVRDTLQFRPSTVLKAINLLILEARIYEQIGAHGSKLLMLSPGVPGCSQTYREQDGTGEEEPSADELFPGVPTCSQGVPQASPPLKGGVGGGNRTRAKSREQDESSTTDDIENGETAEVKIGVAASEEGDEIPF